MSDGAWSQSTCNGNVWWYGVPGQGCHYWTQRFGTHFVGGGVYSTYRIENWECGRLGPPVKDYQWLSEFGAYGQWFEGGAIYYKFGVWQVQPGNYGQTVGRLVEGETAAPLDAEPVPEDERPADVVSPGAPGPKDLA